MFKPLEILLRRIVARGSLSLITHDRKIFRFGDGEGPAVVARLTDRRMERQLALDPHLVVGEAYMDGRLVMEQGRIYDLLALVLENAMTRPLPRWAQTLDVARFLTRRLAQFNPASRSRRNVAHHYDIDGSIYDLFLDADRQYSCAYFTDPQTQLETAQRAKKRHLAAKLALSEGQRVLDIGSGWGGLGIYLAETAGCFVDGVTLSVEQLKIAEARARRAGLANAVHFRLQDYREAVGPYDRIVSVGMFEHVGVNHYGTYFRKVRELLKDDGVAVIHFIGRSEPPSITNPFIEKYIFPGGYIPALSEVMTAIERSGLITTDVEVLRLHYANTLRAWRERFIENWETAARIRDERFCRMWEFYLAGSETAFRYQNLVVFQIQAVRRIDALPLTRDYIARNEAALERAEREGIKVQMPRLAGE
jgi:cyclopropane-fatty-acyl-phospholipid synthase